MENDIAQLILSELKVMNQHMSNVDLRLANVESRLANVESRLDNVESRLDSMETRLDSMETRLDSMETRLDSMETRLDSMETRLDSMETRLGNLEAEVSKISEQQITNSGSIDLTFALVKEFRAELRNDVSAICIITRDNAFDLAKLKASLLPKYDVCEKIDEIIEMRKRAQEELKLKSV